MRKQREVKRECIRILEYVADYHDLPQSVASCAGAMMALKWAMKDGPSPVDQIKKTDKKVRLLVAKANEAKEKEKCNSKQ